MHECDDAALLQKIEEGHAEAFHMLVERHRKSIFRIAYRIVNNQELAEDIAQEILLKLWEKPWSYNRLEGAKFTSWLYRVVCNDAFNRQKRAAFEQPGEALLDQLADPSNIEHHSAVNQMRAIVLQAMDALPKRQKQAVILCVFEELSNKQAAEIMELNISALQSLLMRAKRKLKEIVTTQQIQKQKELRR